MWGNWNFYLVWKSWYLVMIRDSKNIEIYTARKGTQFSPQHCTDRIFKTRKYPILRSKWQFHQKFKRSVQCAHNVIGQQCYGVNWILLFGRLCNKVIYSNATQNLLLFELIKVAKMRKSKFLLNSIYIVPNFLIFWPRGSGP